MWRQEIMTLERIDENYLRIYETDIHQIFRIARCIVEDDWAKINITIA